jgi:hypothetical protein
LFADRLRHFESSRVSTAHGCKNEGSKKTDLTDPTFENVRTANALADADPRTLRISVDTKANVNIGEYSRGGRSRGREPVKAGDHDMRPKKKLAPGGILEPISGKTFLFFTAGNKTSDFLVDGLLWWWSQRKSELPGVKRLVINLDNGPECGGRRTQFLRRMTEFVASTGLTVRLVYYPPYHSKYNAIERYWAGLEKSWNGYLLDTVDCVLRRASNFVWKGARTTVELFGSIYEKGVKLVGKEKKGLEEKLCRSTKLPAYDITIHPEMV